MFGNRKRISNHGIDRTSNNFATVGRVTRVRRAPAAPVIDRRRRLARSFVNHVIEENRKGE